MAYNKRPDKRFHRALYGSLLDNLDAEQEEEVPANFGGAFKDKEEYKLQAKVARRAQLLSRLKSLERKFKTERAKRKEAVNTVLELKEVVNRYQVGKDPPTEKEARMRAPFGRSKRISDIHDGRHKTLTRTLKDASKHITATSFSRNHKFTDTWLSKSTSAPLLRSPVTNKYLDPRLKPIGRGPGFRDPCRCELDL